MKCALELARSPPKTPSLSSRVLCVCVFTARARACALPAFVPPDSPDHSAHFQSALKSPPLTPSSPTSLHSILLPLLPILSELAIKNSRLLAAAPLLLFLLRGPSRLLSRVVSDPRHLFVALGENEACFVLGRWRGRGQRYSWHFLLCQNRRFYRNKSEGREGGQFPSVVRPSSVFPLSSPLSPPRPGKLSRQMATLVSESHGRHPPLTRTRAPSLSSRLVPTLRRPEEEWGPSVRVCPRACELKSLPDPVDADATWPFH